MQHSVDLVILELGQIVQLVPPLEQKLLADQLEPGGKHQVQVLEHLFQFRLRHPLEVSDLVVVSVDGEAVRHLTDQDVVDFVFTPLRGGVSQRRHVVDSRQELEDVDGDFLRGDPQFVLQLTLGGVLSTLNGVFQRVDIVGTSQDTKLLRHTKRVRAAGVGPHVGKSDLLIGALLKQKLTVLVEQEHQERPVQQPVVDIVHDVAQLLRAQPHRLVVVVQHDAQLLHQLDLLLIVAREELGVLLRQRQPR